MAEAVGAAGTVELPTPDAVGVIPMGAAAGKVALVSNATALAGACPVATMIDHVGYGTTAPTTGCTEGVDPTPAPSAVNSVSRAGDGCTDTDNNKADFTAGPAAPRNAASPKKTCS